MPFIDFLGKKCGRCSAVINTIILFSSHLGPGCVTEHIHIG